MFLHGGATSMRYALLAMLTLTPSLAAQSPYRKPPAEILAVLDAPPPPSVSLSPTRDTLLLVQSARYPGIAELAEPQLKLAGTRLNPRTSGPTRGTRVTALTLMPVEGGHPRPIVLPAGKVGIPEWADDGKHFAVAVTTADAVQLWIGTVADATLKQIPGVVLNAAFGDAVQWLPGSKSLLCELVPADRGKPPEAPAVPPGPTIQQSSGTAAPVRTYQDMLQNKHDEDLFTHFATSQIGVVDIDRSTVTKVGPPAIFGTLSASPDGRFVLVSRIHAPYSYLHPSSAFPKTVEVWNASGQVVKAIAEQPLQDRIPIEGVATGPRAFQWLATADSTLIWVEAQDGGDPKKKVPHRDHMFVLPMPGEAGPQLKLKIEHRYAGVTVFPDGDRVLVYEFDRDRRWSRAKIESLKEPAASSQVLFDKSIQDRYGDPGIPLMKRLPNGRSVLQSENDCLFLSSLGATPKGDRPFLDKLDIKSQSKQRLFLCGEGVYETAMMLDDAGSKLLVRRESPAEPGNYYLRDGDKETAITTFTDPAPQLRQVKKQLVTTKRPDGVTISFTLYLPPDYKEGERRPTVFWAYPREFNTADTAGQVSGSNNRFTTISGYSHLFFLLHGYVVMDDVSVPIVGPPESANDTFREQLVASAKAAIDKAVELGPVDRNRIGVGGHSYGAFMTANLLAHSDLFRAGVARSGAYNRTLTPFGFQNERRTFWEAPDVYAKMSPFNSAQKITRPLLLIHGAADDNPGTFPVQSERLYQAVRGNGGTTRLVLLPHEAHGYAARESIEHVLFETIAWFDQYVRDAK